MEDKVVNNREIGDSEESKNQRQQPDDGAIGECVQNHREFLSAGTFIETKVEDAVQLELDAISHQLAELQSKKVDCISTLDELKRAWAALALALGLPLASKGLREEPGVESTQSKDNNGAEVEELWQLALALGRSRQQQQEAHEEPATAALLARAAAAGRRCRALRIRQEEAIDMGMSESHQYALRAAELQEQAARRPGRARRGVARGNALRARREGLRRQGRLLASVGRAFDAAFGGAAAAAAAAAANGSGATALREALLGELERAAEDVRRSGEQWRQRAAAADAGAAAAAQRLAALRSEARARRQVDEEYLVECRRNELLKVLLERAEMGIHITLDELNDVDKLCLASFKSACVYQEVVGCLEEVLPRQEDNQALNSEQEITTDVLFQPLDDISMVEEEGGAQTSIISSDDPFAVFEP